MLEKSGIKGLRSWLGDDLEALLKWVGSIGLPVVLKPHNSSGADGVHICSSKEDVKSAFNSLFGSRNILGEVITRVLAQEFASGEEVVVNTVSCAGRHVISDLWRYRKIITDDGRSVYDGAELVENFGEVTGRTLDYAFQVLDALNIKQGVAIFFHALRPTLSNEQLIFCRHRGAFFSAMKIRRRSRKI